MNSKRVAAVLLAVVSGGAAAQSSVVLYGIADASVAIEDTGAPGASRRKVLNTGNQSTSRFGLRGTEDLGGGLKALFNLEAGLGIDTGVSDTAFFGRRSVVGLEGAFGVLTLGREYTPIANTAAASDILVQNFFGSTLNAFTTGRLTRRLSNSINYKTPFAGPFRAAFVAGAGEGAGPRVLGLSVDYSAGPLFAGAAYHKIKRLSSGDDKEYVFGAGYKFGSVEVKANYLVADPTGPGNKFTEVNLGASLGFGMNRLYANVQNDRLESGAKGKALSIAYTYTLSRRTNLYANYAARRNNASAVFGLVSPGTALNPPTTAPGSDPSVFAAGVRHLF